MIEKVRSRMGVRQPALATLLAIAIAAGATAVGADTPARPTGTAVSPRPVVAVQAASGPQAPQPTHALEKADLESWLDGMLPAALKQGEVAGAVVSVVKDGHVLLAKGYGFSDVARKVPMDAERTLIRPGSTSKLFTWTAVMQLVAQGKLDLNADVNRYLDFKVPEPFGRPITLTDLMTHRAGFEEGLKNAIVAEPTDLEPLDVFVKRHVRPVLFAPGSVPAYSNYGTALAGYIVQRVSGERFDDYVEHHIFAPLAMRNATFRQPLPAGWSGAMSKGYVSAADPPKPFELISFAPAGALSATASDMANFMIAQLQDGRFGDAQILPPETARLMHTPSLPHPAGFDTIAHGFFLDQRNGRAVLEHGGDTIVFHSDLQMLPAEQTGIFVSFNSRGQDDAVYGIRTRLIEGFMDRYFPGPAPVDPPAIASARADAQQIAGRYETSRRVQSGFMSLFYVLQGQQVVGVNADATISLSLTPDKRYREVAPLRWQEEGGSRILTLEQPGGLKTIVDSHDPIEVFQATPLKRNATVNLTVFLLSLAVLLSAAIAWPIAEGARRFYRQPPALTGNALLARRLARIAVIADLGYLVAWFVVLKPILSSDVGFYTSALDPVIRTLQILCLVPLLGVVAGVWNAVLSIRSARSYVFRIASALVAAGMAGIVWIAYVGGLMSFTLNY
jgi:CubicO group peptidase (beta-lactamase class C family)